MRSLLMSDPSLPTETREALARSDAEARESLLELGVNDCVAAELLDEQRDRLRCCEG
jgi:hypothetical protein